MPTKFSVTVRNARLNAIESAIGASAILKLFTGPEPASITDPDAGTELAVMNLPSDWMANASGGIKSKAGTWEDAAAEANGLARYYRIYDNGLTGCHQQGVVSQPWVASSAFIVGQQVHNGTNVYICTTAGTSHSSGGPTGTGTGITDGTCVWDYVDKKGMTLVNTSIAIGQPVEIDTYSITDGNA